MSGKKVRDYFSPKKSKKGEKVRKDSISSPIEDPFPYDEIVGLRSPREAPAPQSWRGSSSAAAAAYMPPRIASPGLPGRPTLGDRAVTAPQSVESSTSRPQHVRTGSADTVRHMSAGEERQDPQEQSTSQRRKGKGKKPARPARPDEEISRDTLNAMAAVTLAGPSTVPRQSEYAESALDEARLAYLTDDEIRQLVEMQAQQEAQYRQFYRSAEQSGTEEIDVLYHVQLQAEVAANPSSPRRPSSTEPRLVAALGLSGSPATEERQRRSLVAIRERATDTNRPLTTVSEGSDESGPRSVAVVKVTETVQPDVLEETEFEEEEEEDDDDDEPLSPVEHMRLPEEHVRHHQKRHPRRYRGDKIEYPPVPISSNDRSRPRLPRLARSREDKKEGKKRGE